MSEQSGQKSSSEGTATITSWPCCARNFGLLPPGLRANRGQKMAEITLAKALEIKNGLAGRLAKVQADIQVFNSVPQGHVG
jgi:hypothetical protein